ncbi:unnamed protein product [Rotaria magnacalcarata]|uniref:Uncharacterized protein n=1 Tax=Rotaria magnacalcarata TaxID=392030 RepID=A0A815TYY1_9BILA|nr:unnamed protein product [Rotaria magnacalcarata]
MTTKNTNSYNREEEQQDETLENFDKMSNDLSWNMREKSKTKKKFDAMEEQNLSEKMRHLSTTTTHEKHPIKILKEIRDQLEIIPNYLTKQNISFKKSMHQVLSSMITAAATAENSNKNVNNINELRKIAILLYKIMKQLMIQICQSKYEQETSEHEYEFLKQQIAYYNLPRQSFECSTISHHPSIDSIQNVTVREALMKQFKEVAIQSRNKLFNLYLESAEDQREEYKKKHQANVMKMDASPDTLNNNEKLSSTFVQLINERCNKISERIKCTYKFKSESIPSKS